MKLYSPDFEVPENQLLGLNLGTNSAIEKNALMLTIDLAVFSYPRAGNCPLQTNKDFNLMLHMNLNQVKVVFMMQQFMRMIDYIMNQVVAIIVPQK